MSTLQRCAFSIVTGVLCAIAALAPARATEPAQDEALAYNIGVQTYIYGFPMMDLYRTLWETSFDPQRGHDRTVNEFFVFDRLITSKDDWVVTANEDTIYLRAFFDLRKEPLILVIPPTTRQYWVPISDLRHDFDAAPSWDTLGARGGNFALCAPGWQGVLPEGVQRIDMGTPIGWMLPRFAVDGPADLPAAVALQKQVRLVPLSQWGAANVTRPKADPADFPRFTRNELTNAKEYFTTLNTLLRLSARIGHPVDEAMAGWLREIQMDPATKFDWDKLSPQARRGLERAATDAHRMIAERMPRVVPIVNNWQIVPSGQAHERRAHGRGLGRDARAALESERGQHLRRGLSRRQRRAVGWAQSLRGPLHAAAAGERLLVADNVLGGHADLRAQCHQPLLGGRSHQGHRLRQGRIARDLPAGRRADRSARAGQLAARAQGAVLSPDPPLLAEGRDPDRRLDAAAAPGAPQTSPHENDDYLVLRS